MTLWFGGVAVKVQIGLVTDQALLKSSPFGLFRGDRLMGSQLR